MSRPSNHFLSGQDNYALAPFLDLLNHQPSVQVNLVFLSESLVQGVGESSCWICLQVKASFNDQTRCYEIRSVAGTKRYHQAFINYGCHDNQRLLLEYGFVAPDNPHSVVYVETGASWRGHVARRQRSGVQTKVSLRWEETELFSKTVISCSNVRSEQMCWCSEQVLRGRLSATAVPDLRSISGHLTVMFVLATS